MDFKGMFRLFKKNRISSPQAETPNEKSCSEAEANDRGADPEGIVTFEERKKSAVPSKRGLYPAEILLLEYVSKGAYPHPKNGYPGFWWYTYGIRDVDTALKSLEERGFTAIASFKDSVKGLPVAQLKSLLSARGYSTAGKKAELVQRVGEKISENDLFAAGVRAKYALMETGQQELNENAYVPYMHKIHSQTDTFNVWSINKLLGFGDKSDWKRAVDEEERKEKARQDERHEASLQDLKEIDPAGYRALREQNEQIEEIQKARKKYEEDKDLDSYIAFWEEIWKNGGLKFEGVMWHFELPDLYIKAKRYDDALDFVIKLQKIKPDYAYKAEAYIQKIKKLQAKHAHQGG